MELVEYDNPAAAQSVLQNAQHLLGFKMGRVKHGKHSNFSIQNNQTRDQKVTTLHTWPHAYPATAVTQHAAAFWS